MLAFKNNKSKYFRKSKKKKIASCLRLCFSKQGHALPKSQMKFANFAKYTYKIVDQKVSVFEKMPGNSDNLAFDHI